MIARLHALKLLGLDVLDDALSFAAEFWRVFLATVVAIALVAGVVFGIGRLIWWNASYTCDRLETAMERPTRLDTWGAGCMVELDDGTEIPVHQLHVVQDEPPR